jgi:RHS repeat-associated protein
MTTASGLTIWAYDPASGRLLTKTDADQKSVSWTHTLAGRPDLRTNARGLVTDYGYDHAGRLTAINYSDTTPDVTILYDQRNRRSQITDAAGTRIPQFSDAGQLTNETITGGVFDGFAVAKGYDSVLRKNALSVTRGTNVIASTAWTYDALSRMESVTQGTDTATTAYHTNSALPSTITHQRSAATKLTTSKTFDALGRLDVLTHTPSTGPPVVFDYGYNAAGLRDTITSADNAFWSISYNDRGEVTSGVRKTVNQTPFPGQEFGYSFDPIGNRLTATVNGRVSIYTPNAVNEYESRTVPGYMNILGEAASDATVTVNGTATDRLGNFFRAELAVSNTVRPVQTTNTTVAVRGDETVSVVSQRFVPETPETFAHDDDGNLTSDGRWTNVWDAENRLIEQTATASSVAAGARNLKLAYAYDYAGRRIQKSVSERIDTNWVTKYSINFVYDGWNPVAEVAVSGGPVVRSYAWGADLSGGEEAGGIGGLAFIRYPAEGKTLAVAADAQGNTAALYDMEDGSIVGSYEYGPFGEPLRVSGMFAEVNPFRFSTKYEDPETGWLYYGYRYYTPATGRWASRDPIGEEGGVNLNAFVSNDPFNFVDPWGLRIYPRDFIGPIGPTDQRGLTKTQETALRELVRREKEYGVIGAAAMSSNTWGDRLISDFNSSEGKTLPTAYGDMDLDWYTDVQSYNYLGRYSATPVYVFGKLFLWNILRGTQGMPIGNFFPFQDPGERRAVTALIEDVKYADLLSDKFFHEYGNDQICK